MKYVHTNTTVDGNVTLLSPPTGEPLSITKFADLALNMTKKMFDAKPQYWIGKLREIGLVVIENRDLIRLRYVIEDPFEVIPYEPPFDEEAEGSQLDEVKSFLDDYMRTHRWLKTWRVVNEYVNKYKDQNHPNLKNEVCWLRDKCGTVKGSYGWCTWNGVDYEEVGERERAWLEDELKGTDWRLVDCLEMGVGEQERLKEEVWKIYGRFKERFGVRVERVKRVEGKREGNRELREWG